MRKQDIEGGNKRSFLREKIGDYVVMAFLILLAVTSELFTPVRKSMLWLSDIYTTFTENENVDSLLGFILSDGSFIRITQDDVNTGEIILNKKSNEKFYKSSFAVNYVRNEPLVSTEISSEDRDGKVVTTAQFEDFLVKYSSMTFNELVGQNYIVDSSTTVTEELINVDKFLMTDCTINKGEKILIYHTHGSEGYADSDGSMEDSVIGVGDYLTELLTEKGYEVIHDRAYYDRENGVVNRNVAYSQALDGVSKILEENPDISVIIDLHRDSGGARTTNINGKEMCKVMLFNGMSYDKNGEIERLPNPNREANLAFSFQLKLMSDCLYDGYMNKIYLKNYRYNMHLKEKCILAEVGTNENTVEQAYNSMEILADVLDNVLTKAE